MRPSPSRAGRYSNGRDGRTYRARCGTYVAGPYDNPAEILDKLRAASGGDGFTAAAA